MADETQNALLALLGVALCKIAINGSYLRFVAPTQLPWLLGAGSIMVLAAAWQIARAMLVRPIGAVIDRGQGSGHDHGHGHGAPRSSWLLVVPVLAMLLVVPPPLGADSVLAAGRVGNAEPRHDGSGFPALPTDRVVSLSMSDFVSRAAWDSAGSLTGRMVRLRGFVVRQGQSVELARLVITCCAADATPMSVRLAGGGGTPSDGQWLEVAGTVVPHSATPADEYVPTLTVRTMRPIAAPEDPYEH